MSSKANPMVIGAFVVGAIVLAIAGVLVLGSGKLFKRTTKAVCYFTGDVMGLNVGAPVKFKGVDIGSVAEVRIRLPEQTGGPTLESVKRGLRIPVIIEIDNDKLTQEGATGTLDRARVKQLVELGLRAQLVSQSFLTGLLLVQLDFNPEIPPTHILPPTSRLLEIPTIPTSMQQIQAAARDVVRKLDAINLEGLADSATRALDSIDRVAQSPGLQQALQTLPVMLSNMNGAVTDLRPLIVRVRGPFLDSLEGTSASANATLKTFQVLIAPDGPLAVDLATALREMAGAAHSVRLLADSLDRNPSALVRGTEVKARLPR
jgi:paraquat-inducible protein B